MLNAEHCDLTHHFSGVKNKHLGNVRKHIYKSDTAQSFDKDNTRTRSGGIPKAPAKEPNNLFYPYFSKRKTVSFDETINVTHANSVTGNLQHLSAKIDKLSVRQMPAHEKFLAACRSTLGFEISAVASTNGKKGAYLIDDHQSIDLLSMGEGVANLLGLIVDLCVAKNQMFLIEEPENDIHPRALKALLDLVLEASANNQFFITTHSNIALKHLGSLESAKIFHTRLELGDDRMPTATVEEVPATPEARKLVLEDLGYESTDFEHWDGWLILEESSAEKIIREYLIPWFTPQLKTKLRTVSSGGTSKISRRFDDLNRLFTFLHLGEIYKDKAWVIIDAGDKETGIVEKLKGTYPKWNGNQFQQFSEHDFERFYPSGFQEEVSEILAIDDKQQKRTRKKELLAKVEAWITEDAARAKEAFKASSSEVIGILKQIRTALH